MSKPSTIDRLINAPRELLGDRASGPLDLDALTLEVAALSALVKAIADNDASGSYIDPARARCEQIADKIFPHIKDVEHLRDKHTAYMRARFPGYQTTLEQLQ